MLRFIQKLLNKAEKTVSALASEINRLKELLSEEMMKSCSFFKICNFFLKTSAFFWISLSSWFLRNFLCLCKCRNLMLSWVNFSRNCCWQKQMNSFFFFKDFLTWKIWWISENYESSVSKYDFLEWTHLLQFLNWVKKT